MRTRLKLTIGAVVLLTALTLYPMYHLNKDANNEGAWVAWGLCVTSMSTLIGYYTKKETDRPSFMNFNFEDESDPDSIPL